MSCQDLLNEALPNQAEPFAVETDLTQASIELELACLATDSATCQQHLENVSMWLQRAAMLYTAGERSPALASDVNCAAGQVQGWLANSASWGDLPTFQQGQLYPFQGVLAALMGEAVLRQGRDAMLVANGLFGLFIVCFAAQLYKGRPARR